MTRIVLAGLAVCWLVVGVSVWRGRRRDVVRRGPVRWHRAVATLQHWSVEDDGPPVAATWCRPLLHPAVAILEVPHQRHHRAAPTSVDAELSPSRPR